MNPLLPHPPHRRHRHHLHPPRLRNLRLHPLNLHLYIKINRLIKGYLEIHLQIHITNIVNTSIFLKLNIF